MIRRALILFAIGSFGIVGQVHAQAPVAQGQAAQKALVDKYCVTCHNEKLKTGGLTLDRLDMSRVAQDAQSWEKVIRKVRGRMMPPVGMPRPDDAALNAFTGFLETTIDRAAAVHANPGRVSIHRLNRLEYGNAIRDLLDLEAVDLAGLLPVDDDSDGFDNIANVLKESPAFLESYISAAREASRLAVGDPTAPMSVKAYQVDIDVPQSRYIEGMPLGTRGGLRARYYFPLDGEYKFDVKLTESAIYIRGLEFPHQVEMSIDGERVFIKSIGGEEDLKKQDQGLATAQADIQKRFSDIRLKMKAGPHTIAIAFVRRALAITDDSLQPYTRDTVKPGGGMTGIPGVQRLDIKGPFNPTGPGDTASRRRIFICKPANPSEELPCARKILTALATRAFRRPVNGADMEAPLSFYQTAKNKGGFESGIQNAITYIVSSPKFLYRAEFDPANAAPDSTYRISDLELASRLSFFLWSSVPDDELLKVANEGKLKDPLVLEKQVRRMLADARSRSMVNSFSAQWLNVRGLAGLDPDTAEYPNWEENLREALKREMELFVGSVFQEDRSVLDLLNGNYTFLNERLAMHYGIQNVRGNQFRRVVLTDENRWGLLGKGATLAVTSYANRTSPVLRGKWILENILGTPPADPPPNVPALKENTVGATVQLSVRQLVEQHRAAPACASCHRIMDPLGFSLENFDGVGQWRSRDHGSKVDASGQLADGTPVDGPASLRKAIMKRPEQFVSTLAEKLLIYATGRSVEYYDMPTIRAIVREGAGHEYKFSSLVMAIVKSAPFQQRKTAPPVNTAAVTR